MSLVINLGIAGPQDLSHHCVSMNEHVVVVNLAPQGHCIGRFGGVLRYLNNKITAS